jgi:hypothetical protein
VSEAGSVISVPSDRMKSVRTGTEPGASRFRSCTLSTAADPQEMHRSRWRCLRGVGCADGRWRCLRGVGCADGRQRPGRSRADRLRRHRRSEPAARRPDRGLLAAALPGVGSTAGRSTTSPRCQDDGTPSGSAQRISVAEHRAQSRPGSRCSCRARPWPQRHVVAIGPWRGTVRTGRRGMVIDGRPWRGETEAVYRCIALSRRVRAESGPVGPDQLDRYWMARCFGYDT